MKKETIYLASLFHDIGKLIERSKIDENKKKVNEIFPDVRYSHAKYTGFFLKSNLSKIDWIQEEKEELQALASYHHNPSHLDGRIIQLADWLASSEREEDLENTAQYNTIQLRSIFGTLHDQPITKYYDLRELSFLGLLPNEPDEKKTREYYHNLSNNMIEEFRRVTDKENLLYFLEKYLSFVPAQTTKNDPDISLFDHSKLTAAIAICLYHQVQNGFLDDEKIKYFFKNIGKQDLPDEHFILINADLSGIQNYIFNIQSKGAAKSLKGRSTYIILLMESICDYLVRELDLEKANIIYNGGGNFYILASASMEEKIISLRKSINQNLFEKHRGKLICNIGITKIKLYEFKSFKDVWIRAADNCRERKLHKFSDIWFDKYDELFDPVELVKEDQYCSVCHSTDNVNLYDGNKLCEFCHSFTDLTKKLSYTNYSTVFTAINRKSENDYSSILQKFGVQIDFTSNPENLQESYILNEFGDDQTLKWKLGAYHLPMMKDEKSGSLRIKEFSELSDTGGKLAYLKLDVDNLGLLFKNGLANPSLSRISVLSRFLRMFFEGFLPYYIKQLNLENDIYIVFSGGDDTFLIGEVETILNLTKKLRKQFDQFACGNKNVTFSAGIGIFRHNFPIIKAARITENYLEEAKEFIYPDELEKGIEVPEKNKVTLLGEVFNWNEFEYVLELFYVIKSIVSDSDSNSRGIIRKIIDSTKGWKPLLDSAQKGKLNSQKIWRLRYFLRTAAKDTKEKIISVYEKMWMDNLYIDESNKEYEIKNHQIITVAAKLADLQTRK